VNSGPRWPNGHPTTPPPTTCTRFFEPTARAIDGLEKALAGLGLLQEALALDLRRPQDYFHRLWSLNFPARDLAHTAGAPDEPQERQ
jgi:hypothetical protein